MNDIAKLWHDAYFNNLPLEEGEWEDVSLPEEEQAKRDEWMSQWQWEVKRVYLTPAPSSSPST